MTEVLAEKKLMAFEMYAGPYAEQIAHHEEFVLKLAYDPDYEQYPQLSALWEAFHDSPRLSPQQSNQLTHELIKLLQQNGGSSNRQLAHIITRWMYFFSAAYTFGLEVECGSD